jgi:RNA polymerase sigma-70 factor (ECF subfamily)
MGPSTRETTSTTLLNRVKAHDADAWRRLIDLYGPVVYGWCRELGVPAEDAADVFQEVFGALAAHVVEFHRDQPGDSFHAWLWTITRNKSRDFFRRRRGRPESMGGTDAQALFAQIPDALSDSSLADPRSNHRIALAQRAMVAVRAEVEDRTWKAFWRLTMDGQAGPDVAEELRMSVHAVYQAKYRVLRRIRQELGDPTD